MYNNIYGKKRFYRLLLYIRIIAITEQEISPTVTNIYIYKETGDSSSCTKYVYVQLVMMVLLNVDINRKHNLLNNTGYMWLP